MQPDNVTPFRMPEIPILEPITQRPASLSPETRCELAASIIGCVLSDMYQIQHDIPHQPFGKLDPPVRRVYEGLARAVAHSLLLPERRIQAERRAVEAAADILENYEANDAHLGIRGLDPALRRKRLTTAFLSALNTFQTEMARETGR